jgi:uncharacterized membrane protein YtjA (UPF0391 family)
MFNFAVGFFILIVALVASLLGFGGVTGLSAQIGWFFALVVVTLLAVALLVGRRGGGLSLPL